MLKSIYYGKPITMNKFEEAIQIAKGVTNFLGVKANIATTT
jgi:hypothetical protein